MAKTMPINAIKLEPEGGDRKDELLSYHIDFDQNYDHKTGKPVGHPSLSQVSMTISRSSEEDEKFYVEWQLEHNKQNSLDICFYSGGQIKRTIKIKNAYLVSYNQDCHDAGTIQESFVLSPEEMTIDGFTWKREDY